MGLAFIRSRSLGTVESTNPVGVIMPYAGSSSPDGWLLCFGQEILITGYPSLYSLLGTTYGSLTNGSGGAGSTHFKIPDLRGRVVAGVDNMGGVSADNLTAAVSGIAGTTLGAKGGNQYVHQHTHTQNSHFHDGIWADGVLTLGDSIGSSRSVRSIFARVGADGNAAPWTTISATATNQNFGSGSSQNVQPTIMLNYIIRVV